ncbi:MAG: hypothetical protein JNK46_05475 [Methylobacteriaceae bacterium]|nr:hypothetical protein [Methylobacteriaceae bacterium]
MLFVSIAPRRSAGGVTGLSPGQATVRAVTEGAGVDVAAMAVWRRVVATAGYGCAFALAIEGVSDEAGPEAAWALGQAGIALILAYAALGGLGERRRSGGRRRPTADAGRQADAPATRGARLSV